MKDHRNWTKVIFSILAFAMVPIFAQAQPQGFQGGSQLNFPQVQDTQFSAPQVRQRFLLDFGWKFALDSTLHVQPTDVGFDDSKWRDVDLPHDWSIEGPWAADNISGWGGGHAPIGIGWYRKHFVMPAEPKGKKISLEFEGVFNHAEAWVNGNQACRNDYGYIGFECDITPWLNIGKDNVITVRADNSRQASRWYTGSGIYRHVWLTVTNSLHVAHWGTYITIPDVEANRAQVKVETTVRNDSDAPRAGTVVTSLLDPAGKTAGITKSPVKVGPQSETKVTQLIAVADPQLWSPGTPRLYRALSEIRDGRRVLDTYQTPFGIRTVKFDVTNALTVNGKRVVLKGVDMHGDLGALGAADFESGYEHRLKVLQSLGVNALRLSHNPHAPGLLALCDRMGILVFDEAYDKWRGFQPDGTGWTKDLGSFIRRDRNHPSVIAWSAGNEVQNQNSHASAMIFKGMRDFIHGLEPTRPVTAALERTRPNGRDNRSVWAPLGEMANYMDIIMENYQTVHFARDHQFYPNKVLVSGEVTPFPSNLAPPDIHDPWFATQDYKTGRYYSYVAGQFIWAGADYLGEAGRFPNRGNGSFGLITTADFIKPSSYYIKSLYSDKPMVKLAVESAAQPFAARVDGFGGPNVQASWNWPDSVKMLRVFTYTNAPVVELFLNGKSLGEKQLADFDERMMYFEVPNEPGTVRAVARRDGVEVASDELKTAGAAARLVLIPNHKHLNATGRDLSYIEVQVTDANGVIVPDARNLIRFEISGAGKIAGVDNGDLRDQEPYKATQREARDGRCWVIVQSGRQPGKIRLVARAAGLKEASIQIDVLPGTRPATL